MKLVIAYPDDLPVEKAIESVNAVVATEQFCFLSTMKYSHEELEIYVEERRAPLYTDSFEIRRKHASSRAEG